MIRIEQLNDKSLIWKWERTREAVDDGVPVPRWYLGLTYRDFQRDVIVYHVIPFNIIIAAWKWLVLVVRFRISYKLRELSVTKIYQRGYIDGYAQAHKDWGRASEKLNS